MPAGGGRPTELTPDVLAEVTRVLPVVLYVETLADYIGVTRFTVRNWIKRGKKEEKRLRHPRAKPCEREAIFLQFFYAIKKAIADGQFHSLQIIRNAAATQWTAAAWLMERRFPEQWSGVKGEIAEVRRLAMEALKGRGANPAQAEAEAGANRNGRGH